MELLLMIVITGIAMPPLIALLLQINKESSTIVPYVEPSALAIELMEEIKGKKWDENWIGGKLDDADKTPPSVLGADFGETTRAAFDDMDDYISIPAVPQDIHGTALPQYKDYTVKVICYNIKPQAANIYWRPLGEKEFKLTGLKKISDTYWIATIPSAGISDDFEYYIRMEDKKEYLFPASAPSVNHAVVLTAD